jgi:hypothetical protein
MCHIVFGILGGFWCALNIFMLRVALCIDGVFEIMGGFCCTVNIFML